MTNNKKVYEKYLKNILTEQKGYAIIQLTKDITFIKSEIRKGRRLDSIGHDRDSDSICQWYGR